jgi:CheY-like chemotaxis protein
MKAEGYDIISAGDGEEALAIAIKERPQLIVSDVMMPKISGFDMLDILRSTSETKNIKVIMMTALSSVDQRQRGEQLGADRYLVKSQVGIEDVVRTIHDVLGDAPVAAASPVAPQPATPAPATPPVQPAPQPPVSTPPAPAPAPTAQPAAPQTPQAPAMTSGAAAAVPPVTPPAPATPAASSLPQPTAPFSTPRPAGLADRIIQPLEHPAGEPAPMKDLMDRELGNAPGAPAPVQPAPAAPPAQPVPTPPQPAENHGIAFEETPRPPAAPATPQPPQN